MLFGSFFRLRASGRPYIAYDPGMTRDALAYHGCSELFQDVHTELIQHRRSWMIKRGIIKEKHSVNSAEKHLNGSCPLMPEE
ncbi:O-fucosyltransferase family protein, partial [Thalictrum thalictroides]